MQSFLDGKRTWIGLVLTLAGLCGISQYITNDQLSAVLDALFTIGGVVITAWGNYKAQNKIKDLKVIRDDMVDHL